VNQETEKAGFAARPFPNFLVDSPAARRESTHQGSTPIMSAAMNTKAAHIIKALIGRVSPMA